MTMTDTEPGGPAEDPAEKKESSTGLDPKVAGLLCYVLGWVTGLIFLLIEKDNKFVRFHAIQSIAVFGTLCVIWIPLMVLSIIPIIGLLFLLVMILLWIGSIVLWILLMYKAYQEEMFKVPIAGDFAEERA